MKLRDLFVSIGFDVDDRQIKALNKGLSQTKTLVLALGAAATASAGLLFSLAKSVAGVGDKAAKTADKLGVDIEALQELRYAAELSGIAQTQLDTALQRMTRRAAEAAQGTGEAKSALRSLNVTLTDGQGRMRRSEDLLYDIADGLSKIHDPARRVALAFKLFDTEGVGMVNMLAKGSNNLRAMRSEARELGAVLSRQAARDSEVFTDELTRATAVVAGIKNTIGAQLLPVFVQLMQQFRQWVLLNRQVIASRVDRFIKALIALIGTLYRWAKSLVAIFAEIISALGGIERVVKAADWAMKIFIGAQVLAAVGNLVLGFIQLTKVIRGVGNAALIANLKAAAIPVLIGAAVAAAILIIQDLVSYFQGKKSVTAVMLAAFEKHFPMIYRIMTLTIGDALFWIEKAFDASVDWIMEKLQPLLSAIKSVRTFLQSTGSKIMGAFGAMDQFFGLAPDTAPAGGTNVTSRQDVRVHAPVTVNVPEGTPPEIVGRAVQQGVSDGIARMLRDTSLATEPQVEY